MSSAAVCAWEYEAVTPPDWGYENPELEEEVDRARPLFAHVTDDEEDNTSPDEKLRAFDRSIDFLASQSKLVRALHGVSGPVPNIDLGPSGSVDLHWKRANWELLVNIPADPNRQATFYGDNQECFKFMGSFNPKKVNYGIASWLMKNHRSR